MKTAIMLITVLLGCLLLAIPATSAQSLTIAQASPQVVIPDAQNFVLDLLLVLVAKYPIVATLIAFVGSMRLWAKPLFSAVHAIVDITPNKWDDGLWARCYKFFTETKTGKLVAFALDWLGSVKIQPPVKKE